MMSHLPLICSLSLGSGSSHLMRYFVRKHITEDVPKFYTLNSKTNICTCNEHKCNDAPLQESQNTFRTTAWPDMKGHYFEQQDKQDVHSVDSNYSASQSRPSRYEGVLG